MTSAADLARLPAMLAMSRAALVGVHDAVEGAGLDEVVVLGVPHRRRRSGAPVTARPCWYGSPVSAGPSWLLGS